MRRFLISSPAFNNQAELIYNTDGILVKIDCTQCNMPGNLMQAFKAKVPTSVDGLEAAFKDSRATVVEGDFEITYEMFWNAYDKKINNKRCVALWNKLSKVNQVKAYYGIAQYDKYLSRDATWRSKADPETYLRNYYWENDWR